MFCAASSSKKEYPLEYCVRGNLFGGSGEAGTRNGEPSEEVDSMGSGVLVPSVAGPSEVVARGGVGAGGVADGVAAAPQGLEATAGFPVAMAA